MSLAVLVLLVLAIATAGTGILRRYALARSVLDIPNARSSHTVPTPRGGGVAIVLAFLVGVIGLALIGHVDSRTMVAILGAGTLVAVVGFIDDHRHIAARWRLLAHFAAAAWALAWLGGLPPIEIFGRPLDAGLAGDLLAAVGLVWLLNLYNFMDGIDGIAGIEACTTCLAATLLVLLGPGSEADATLPLLLATASLGFLVWNFPPARIFMGDAGSGFVGLMLGIVAIVAARGSPGLLWAWLILLGAFIVDATVTLLRRLRRGARLHEAHRTHAYQHAARRAGGHRPVTLAVAAINLFWLLPWSLMVTSGQLPGVLALIAAYLPLVGLTLALRAGLPERALAGPVQSPTTPSTPREP